MFNLFAFLKKDVQDDVIGAQKAGLIGMLVRTGKYRTSDEQKTDIPPDFVFDSIVNAVDFILDHNQKCS